MRAFSIIILFVLFGFSNCLAFENIDSTKSDTNKNLVTKEATNAVKIQQAKSLTSTTRIFKITTEPSVLANVTAIYFNGEYQINTAGIGVGVAWHKVYVAELNSDSIIARSFQFGLYAAPKFSGGGTENPTFRASVSLIGYFSPFDGIGVGIGFDFWRQSVQGLLGPVANDRVFLTLNYSFLNAPAASNGKTESETN